MKKINGVEFFNRPSTTEEDIITAAGNADAVVVVTEPYTSKVINNLKSCRLISTPKTGYDNIEAADIIIPSLTTVGINKEELGRISVKRLMERINNPDMPVMRITLETEIIARESTRKI